MKLDGYISELLYNHDCVIVTGLGGFIAHYHPAGINPALNVISPPSKKLAFNASLKNNDGLLANHIAQREVMSYSESVRVINEFVDLARQNMDEGKRLKIENVGVLFIDKQKNLQFLPDQHVNYLIDSFGLSPVHAPVIKKIEKAHDLEEYLETEPDEVVAENRRKPAKFRWNVLEVIPAAAVLALLLMVPPVLEQVNSNLSTLLPFSRINEFIDDIKGENQSAHPITIHYPSPFETPPPLKQHETVAVSNENSGVVAQAEELPAAEEVKEAVAPEVSIAKSNKPAAPAISGAGNTLTYHIIGGSFRSLTNANNFAGDLKAKNNIEAIVIGQNKAGLYLVSLLSSNSPVQIQDALAEFKSNTVPDAWVYKKK